MWFVMKFAAAQTLITLGVTLLRSEKSVVNAKTTNYCRNFELHTHRGYIK
jgi:hypothetical protein